MIEIDTGEVVLFWDTRPRDTGKLARALRADLAQLEADEFLAKWRRYQTDERLARVVCSPARSCSARSSTSAPRWRAEITAGAGFDWLVVDLEHGAGGREATLAQLQAARAPAIVRVPSADERGDRLGARPRRRGRRSSRACAALARGRERGPPPPATRARAGSTPARARARFGRDAGYAERADDERVLMVQIETRGALDEVGRDRGAARCRRAVRRPLRPRRRARGHARRRDARGAGGGRAAVAAAARAGGKAAAVFLGDPGSRRATASSASRSSARASRARCWPAATRRLAALRP